MKLQINDTVLEFNNFSLFYEEGVDSKRKFQLELYFVDNTTSINSSLLKNTDTFFHFINGDTIYILDNKLTCFDCKYLTSKFVDRASSSSTFLVVVLEVDSILDHNIDNQLKQARK